MTPKILLRVHTNLSNPIVPVPTGPDVQKQCKILNSQSVVIQMMIGFHTGEKRKKSASNDFFFLRVHAGEYFANSEFIL
jgi:hypothetical protein